MYITHTNTYFNNCTVTWSQGRSTVHTQQYRYSTLNYNCMSVRPAAPNRGSDVKIGLLHSPGGQLVAVKSLYLLPRSTSGRRELEVSGKKTATGVSPRKRRDLIPSTAAMVAAAEVRWSLTVPADAAWRRLEKRFIRIKSRNNEWLFSTEKRLFFLNLFL